MQFLHQMFNVSALLLDDALLKCFVTRELHGDNFCPHPQPSPNPNPNPPHTNLYHPHPHSIPTTTVSIPDPYPLPHIPTSPSPVRHSRRNSNAISYTEKTTSIWKQKSSKSSVWTAVQTANVRLGQSVFSDASSHAERGFHPQTHNSAKYSRFSDFLNPTVKLIPFSAAVP